MVNKLFVMLKYNFNEISVYDFNENNNNYLFYIRMYISKYFHIQILFYSMSLSKIENVTKHNSKD